MCFYSSIKIQAKTYCETKYAKMTKESLFRTSFIYLYKKLFQCFFHFNFLERFNKIVFLNIVVVFNLNTTIVSFRNLFYIVFKTFQCVKNTCVNYNSFAD